MDQTSVDNFPIFNEMVDLDQKLSRFISEFIHFSIKMDNFSQKWPIFWRENSCLEFIINYYDQIKMNVLELNTVGLHQFRIATKQDDTSIVPPCVTSFYSIVQELRERTILKRTERSKKP